MALRIDRLWNQIPGWYRSQDRSTRVTLLAEYRLLHETPEQALKGAKSAKRAELKRRMEAYNV